MRTIIDVGASNGLFANFIANQSIKQGSSHSVRVFAVEPIPKSAEQIGERENLTVIVKGILPDKMTGRSGTRKLYITKNLALSSFQVINKSINKVMWQYYLPSLVIESEVSVPCVSLKDLMSDNKITKVDFLKIDTQGTDLEVFLSAGKDTKKIMSCVLEVPYTKKFSIYQHESDLVETVNVMAINGFFPIRVVPNGGGECNLFFLNSEFSVDDYFQLENELEFNRAPCLKIGKHQPMINSNFFEKLIYALRRLCRKSLDFVLKI
jgi:FkbM family methyltransferase